VVCAVHTERLTRVYKVFIKKGYFMSARSLDSDFFYDLWKKLTAKKEVIYALNNINIDIRKGEFVCLLGPNGSGKTTLLRILAGLLMPSSGRVEVMGYDVVNERTQVLKVVSYIPSLLASSAWARPNLSLWENMKRIARLLRIPTEDLVKAMVLLGLNDVKDMPFGALSTGQQARATIALGIVKGASVYLLDEPGMGLSPEVVRTFHTYIKELNKKAGATVVYATHHPHIAEELANRVIILYKGKIIADGNPEELIRKLGKEEIIESHIYGAWGNIVERLKKLDPLYLKVRQLRPEIGEYEIRMGVRSSRETLPRLIDMLVQEGVKIYHIKIFKPSLEDVFIHLVEGR